MRFRIILLLTSALLLSAAESGRLEGPVPALVFDSAAKAIRPMIGIAGSSYLGDALANDVENAVASSDGRKVAYAKDGSLYLLQNGTPRLLAENGGGAIAWSADGATLATAGRLFRIADGSALQLAAISGGITALAAAKDHAVAATGRGIWLLRTASTRQLAQADKAVSLAIDGKDLYFADRARGEVWLLRDYAEGGDPVLVSKVEGATAVAVTRGSILIAAGRKVMAIRSGSFDPVFELPLEFEASSLTRLNSSTWLLNAGQSGPLQVLSLDGDAAVYFVPRGEEAN